jgi:CubicO group peptidase (beta-lactamase class C family)
MTPACTLGVSMIHTQCVHARTPLCAACSREPASPASPGVAFLVPATWPRSNAGYILLGHLVEVVTNKAFTTLINEWIKAPLGLDSLGFYQVRAPGCHITSYRDLAWPRAYAWMLCS